MRIAFLVVLAAAACGRVGFEELAVQDGQPGGEPVDATVASNDAKVGPRSFGAPTMVPELSIPGASLDDPSLTADMLEIYFKLNQGGSLEIHSATRASLTSPWSAPALVDELASVGDNDTPEVSSDGLTMYFASSRNGNVDIYLSTRADRAQPWGAPVPVSELSSPDPDYSVVRNAEELDLVASRIVAGEVDLYFASRASTKDPWGTPLPLSTLNTAGREADAILDPTGLRMYYTVEGPGTALRDVYYTERPSLGDTFAPGLPVPELNSPEHDEDPWVSPDLEVIYFSRSDADGSDIYVAVRQP